MTHRTAEPCPTLVVGLGSMDRGDDAIGRVVAARVGDEVAAHGPDRVQVVVHDDPTSLLDLFDGRDVVVIADAIRSGAPAGTVTRHEVGKDSLPLPTTTDSHGAAGTHGLGLAAMLALGRALDRLPDRVVVVGVEATGFEHGSDLSAPVAAAVEAAVAAIMEILRVGEQDVPEPL